MTSLAVWQISKSDGQRCGVAQFARGLERALGEAGVSVATMRTLNGAAFRPRPDAVLVQYEAGLFREDSTFQGLRELGVGPVVMVAHSPGGERFAADLSGVVVMAEGVVQVPGLPLLRLRHPAAWPGRLSDRADLRRRFSLPPDRVVLGSSGYLFRHRRWPEVVEELLPEARRRGWLIDLVTSHWRRPDPELEARLAEIAAAHPDHVRFGARHLAAATLNERLQACDLLWCWTANRGGYASGTASDQYASGTRMVVADLPQHAHVLGLPNVVRAPAERSAFVAALRAEARAGPAPRHDPAASGLDWGDHAGRLRAFIEELSRRARTAP